MNHEGRKGAKKEINNNALADCAAQNSAVRMELGSNFIRLIREIHCKKTKRLNHEDTKARRSTKKKSSVFPCAAQIAAVRIDWGHTFIR